MRLKPETLIHDLKKKLRAVYLLSGDEPLQLMETADSIRSVARVAGFTERQVFHVDRSFDWGQLLLEANSLSLFAEKKILELRLTSAKPGDIGSKTLAEYCQRLSDDNILIISMPKIDKRSQSTKWFKALDQAGAVIQVWPVESSQLPRWIHQRMQSKGLSVSKDAAALLAEKVEGNLLAAAQEVEKLSLKAPATINIEDILAEASDEAKYDVFKLVDAAISGKHERVAKILFGLKASGEVPSMVLWALTREVRTLISISYEIEKGAPISQAFRNNQIWDSRASVVQMAIKRYTHKQWLALLSQAIKVDHTIKGMQKGNVWDELLDLGFSISGSNILNKHAVA